MTAAHDYGIGAALDRITSDRRPLTRRIGSRDAARARVVSSERRRVVLRARIAVDYPTHVEPADIRYWLGVALVAEAASLDLNIDLLQVASAADPAWRSDGPPDLSAAVGPDLPGGNGR